MADVGKGYTFGATEQVTAAKLHSLVDDASVTNIVNADVAAGAAIDATKLNLTTAGYMTSGGNFTITGTHTFSTAPVLPASTIDAITEIATALKSGSDATLVTGTKGTANYIPKWDANGDLIEGYALIDDDTMATASATAVASSESIKAYTDTKAGYQVFVENGTFTAPAGVSKVFVTMVGGGGGGGSSKNSADNSGGGGGGGEACVRVGVAVTAEDDYTVTVGAGGAGGVYPGASGDSGDNGGDTSFAGITTITVSGGSGGAAAGTGGAGGAANSMNGSGGTGGAFYSLAGGTGATVSGTGAGGGGGGSMFGVGGAGGVDAGNDGSAGTGFGSGGGGGRYNAADGGAGAGGFVLVEW